MEKINEILTLCIKINTETDLNATFDYAGHVNNLCVRIRKDVFDGVILLANEPIYNVSLYIDRNLDFNDGITLGSILFDLQALFQIHKTKNLQE